MRSSLRAAVLRRASGCCEYCGWPEWLAPGSFDVEHIFPRSRGGTDRLNNLAYSCHGCNSAKYDATTGIDPVTGEEAPLFHPRHDSWDAHFLLNADERTWIGISPTGRASIRRLRLNRPEVLRMRRTLQLFPTPESLDTSD